MKKLCTILAALTLVVLCFFLSPAEAEAASDSALIFVLNDGGTSYYVKDCSESARGELTIPSTYNGLPVTRIGYDAFYNCINLTSIVIPDSVTSIGGDAFYNCTNLTSIVIPDSVTSIGGGAFYNCTNLTSVYITDITAWCNIWCNDMLNMYGNPLCYGGKLYLNGILVTDLVIPDNVTHIGMHAFAGCTSLTSVTISDSVTSIGMHAFLNCSNLASVKIPCSINSISVEAYEGCTSLSQVHITDVTAWCAIEFESANANPLFYAAALYLNGEPVVDLVIPEGVTHIGSYAFRSCTSLKTVTIPTSVTSIGSYAFNYCHGLKGVYISDLEAWCKVDFGSFSSNPLNYGNILYLNSSAVTELVIPEGITTVNDFAFFNCKSLTRVIIPDGVTEIGDKAFYNCLNMTQVAIPRTMNNICTEAFYNTAALEKVIFCGDDLDWASIKIDSSNSYVIHAPHGHDWVKYTCAVCGLERVDESLVYFGAPGISFQDYIGLQVMFKDSVANGYEKFYAEIIQETPNGVVTTTTTGIPFNSAYRYFENRVVSWSMTEPITMTLCGEKNGEVYKGASFTTTIMDLAMEKLLMYEFEGDLARCKAFVDMLNYGAAVQTAYDYNANNLPNADLGVFEKYATTATPTLNGTNNITGTGSVKVYKDNISLQDKVEFQLMVKTSALSGKTVKATLAGQEVGVAYTEVDGFTIIRVAVLAAHMRDTYTIGIYDASGNAVSPIYKVSVEAYAQTQMDTDRAPALIAMMKYGDAVSKI